MGFSVGWLAVVSGSGGSMGALAIDPFAVVRVRMLAALAIRHTQASNPAIKGWRCCGVSRKSTGSFKVVNRIVGLWFWVRGCWVYPLGHKSASVTQHPRIVALHKLGAFVSRQGYVFGAAKHGAVV